MGTWRIDEFLYLDRTVANCDCYYHHHHYNTTTIGTDASIASIASIAIVVAAAASVAFVISIVAALFCYVICMLLPIDYTTWDARKHLQRMKLDDSAHWFNPQGGNGGREDRGEMLLVSVYISILIQRSQKGFIH